MADDLSRVPLMSGVHTPPGMFQVVSDHPSDCRCEAGSNEIWLSSDTAAKWQAP